MWIAELEQQFIAMVEDRPSLFVVAGKSYSNKQVKTESWRQISEALNISVKELRKKWDSLRTQFTRYRKLPPSGSSAAEKTSRQKWVLRRLQFLEPHTKRKESTSNLAHKEPTAPTDTGSGASADARFDGQRQAEIETEEDWTYPIEESTMCDMETSSTPATSTGPPAKRSRSPQKDDASETPQGLMRSILNSWIMWTEEIEEQLVSMVEERPSLFAAADKNYSSRLVKTESWCQISEKMNISERELRKKWESLRTQFTRYRKLPPSGSLAAEKTSRQKWVLRRLQFLEPHTKRKESTSNLAHKEPTAPTDPGSGASADARFNGQRQAEIETEEDWTYPIEESTMCDMETSSTPATSTGPPAKRRIMWTEEIEEQLVSMVEERPSMFAAADKNYSSRLVKTESWRQISEKMNISERELRKKWDSLRTQFTRYRKLPPSGSSAAEKTLRQKRVLRRLQFLKPHTKRKESTSNLAHKEPTAPTDTGSGASADARFDGQRQEEIETEEDQTLPIAEPRMCDMKTSSTPATSTGPPAKRSRSPQKDDASETPQGLMRLIGAALERRSAEERQPEDFIAVACKGIEHKFRMVPPHLVPRLENTIQNLIFNFCEEHNLTHNRDGSGLDP